MKILFVAMTDSVHSARWISQVADQGWELHLFPSIDAGLVHPELRNLTAHVPLYGRRGHGDSVRVVGLPIGNDFLASGVSAAFARLVDPEGRLHARRLASLIRRLEPDVIHSLEIQHAGYLVAAARTLLDGRLPPWIVSNWGSDIYLYGRLAEHQPKIREVLEHCDFYACECQRDVELARQMGLRGTALEVMPNSGGFDLEASARLSDGRPPSQRKLIVLKGYQNWAGRALVGLRALERCAELLAGYEIAIYSASRDVELAARLFSVSTGVPTHIVPPETPHPEMLRLHGRARLSIGLSISDAISTSLLEAMVMGSFPIQSCTACADEWIEDGRTGLVVPPEDPELVECALRRALGDDALVDQAALDNRRVAEARLARGPLRDKVLEMYRRVGRQRAR